MDDITNKAAKIQLAVFDVDGVMTDGSLILGEDGNEHKIFHVHDGLGLVMLQENGIRVAIITSRSSKIVSQRMAELGIELVCQNQTNKQKTLNELMQQFNIPQDCVAYTGDDLIDLPAMSTAGLALTVANAHPQVLAYADWISTKSGGQGAVREICEMLLNAQGKLEQCYRNYSGVT